MPSPSLGVDYGDFIVQEALGNEGVVPYLVDFFRERPKTELFFFFPGSIASFVSAATILMECVIVFEAAC